jgi:subtilisin-like proprotein convertase family protein
MNLRCLPPITFARLGFLALFATPACGDDTTPSDDTGTTGDTSTTGMTMTAGMTTAPSTMTMTGADDTSSSDGGVDTTVGDSSSSEGGEESSSSSEGGEESSSSSEGGESSSSSSEGGEESSSSSTGVPDTCGNATIDAGEDCDGVELGAETCETQGFPGGGTLACAPDCTFDTGACVASLCGNGAIDAGEDCDGAELGDATCVSEGFPGGGTLACAVDCTFDTGACVGAVCGNGVLEGAEACDGTDFGGATCADFGGVFGDLACDGSCAIDSTACSNTTTVCATPGTAIGPAISSFVESLDTAGEGFVTDIDVYMDATHTFVGDMDVQIRHAASGTDQFILQDQCGTSEDVLATFDQDAAAAPDCVIPIAVEGSVLPNGNLDALVGAPAGATWELEVADDAGGDGGTLNEWCVVLEGSVDDPVVCGDGAINFGEECDGGVGALDCTDFGFADGTLACDGTTCTVDTSGCFDVCGDGLITGAEDCDGFAIAGGTCESEGFAGGALDCDPVTCAYDPAECSNTVIAACVAPAAPFTNTTPVSSVITLADVGTIADIDVRTDIPHTFTGDVEVTLVNEALGISVMLLNNQCGGDNDIFATFNDEASGVPDCVEPVGIEGNVLPQAALSAFDGSAIAGDWTLQVVDTAAGDNGTLDEWCVYITPA